MVPIGFATRWRRQCGGQRAARPAGLACVRATASGQRAGVRGRLQRRFEDSDFSAGCSG